jgi:formylglycine-generating enzyme required for sulfatase activity
MARAPRKTGRRPADAPLHGFISYSHDDVAMMRRFRAHLTSVEKAFEIPFWVDDSIQAGDHWDDSILAEINRANVFLLLISPSTIDSRYINEKEYPAIVARAQAVKGLICPVVLSPCDWQRVVGPLEPAPKLGQRLQPVSTWTNPEDGYDTARQAVHAAIRSHFKREPRNGTPFDALVGYREDQPGPVYVIKNDQFELDPGGGQTDIDAAATNVARQLHEANRRKAAALLAMMPRLHNSPDAVWTGLADAVDRLHQALDRPIEDIPDHIAAIWETSVSAASFLLIDKGLRDGQSQDPAPLPLDMHRAFDDLVGSLAPWIRGFPTARELDDDRGAFLAQPGLFATAAAVIQGARDADLLTPATDATLRAAEATARRETWQAAKAGTFSIKAARGLLTRSGSYFAGFLAGAVASSYATHSPLTDQVELFLARIETHAAALIVDLPADIRIALTELIEEVAKGDVAQRVNVDNVALITTANPTSRSLLPGTSWRDGPDYPEMILIPPGQYLRGAPHQEEEQLGVPLEHRGRSAPQRLVTIQQPFWLGRFPVTRAEFASFANNTDYKSPDVILTLEPNAGGDWAWEERTGRGWRSPGFDQNDNHPVVCISYNDALSYIAWLNARTTGGYRLPTEAEWEYAARAGTATARFWGDQIDQGHRFANMADQSLKRHLGRSAADRQFTDGDDGFAFTAPVGAFQANAFGLHDMIGNVWEWCADPWHDNYYGAPDNGAVWATGDSYGTRVIRGGSWFNDPWVVRVSYRDGNAPGYHGTDCGFRLARDA